MFKRWMAVGVAAAAVMTGCESDDAGTCPAPLVAQVDGSCVCPPGTTPNPATMTCVAPATTCPTGTTLDPVSMTCVTATTPPPQTNCAAGTTLDPATMTCVPDGQPANTPTCGANSMLDAASGNCVCVATAIFDAATMACTLCPAGTTANPATNACDMESTGGGTGASCAEADTSGDTYEAMQAMVTTRCGICHRQSQAPRSAGLQLAGTASSDRLDDLLMFVDKPSCQTTMPVVDRSGGDAALANSWLWWKVAGASEGMDLVAQPDWMSTGDNCQQLDPAKPFGTLMPQGASEPTESVAAAVRNWICAGAPGPAGGTGGMDSMLPMAGSGGTP